MEEDNIELPHDASSTSLPDGQSKTDCVVKSGESVIILGHKSFKLPDGHTTTDISDCKLQSGSSLILYFDEDKQIGEKPTKVKEKQERISIPVPIELTATTSEQVLQNLSNVPIPDRPSDKDSSSSALMIAATIATAIIAAVVINNAVKKRKRLSSKQAIKIQQQQKRKEDKKKCDGKSQNILILADEINQQIDNSKTSNNDKNYQEFLKSAEILKEKIETLDGKVDKLRKKMAEKTSK